MADVYRHHAEGGAMAPDDDRDIVSGFGRDDSGRYR